MNIFKILSFIIIILGSLSSCFTIGKQNSSPNKKENKLSEKISETLIMEENYISREELKKMIKKGQNISHVNTSKITDMSFLFYKKSDFNQDISNWDVSNVTNMEGMFCFAYGFYQDISAWDVSSVKDMRGMFSYTSSFNQDISA